jgi:multimeric flavodoxin WrbA
MKSKAKLLAIVGSQRKNGNSYLVAKKVLESVGANHEIVQLADSYIEFCNLCEKCLSSDCVLDDFNKILEQMKNADGIIFAFPKYVLFASKFICFLERIATFQHMRENMGYKMVSKNSNYRLFPSKKPFCIFVTSGSGKIEKENLQTVAGYMEGLGLKLVPHDLPPFVGVNIKAGDDVGEALENAEGLEECKKLTEKLVASIQNGDSGTPFLKS